MSEENPKTALDHVTDTLLQLKEMRHYSKNNVEMLTTGQPSTQTAAPAALPARQRARASRVNAARLCDGGAAGQCCSAGHATGHVPGGTAGMAAPQRGVDEGAAGDHAGDVGSGDRQCRDWLMVAPVCAPANPR